MKVALFTAAVTWSGVEVHTVQLASALQRNGHEVIIVELGPDVYAKAAARGLLKCEVVRVAIDADHGTSSSLGTVKFRTWRRILKGMHADAVVAVKGTFKFGSTALEAALRVRFPCFLTVEHLHAPLAAKPPVFGSSGWRPRFSVWWYRGKAVGHLRSLFPRKVICVSHAVRRTLLEDYGFPAQKVVTVHNGVDTSVFIPDPKRREAAREAWGVPDDVFIFGSVGRLSPMKNHTQLINVFADLVQQSQVRRDVRLVIIGDGPLRSNLESLARERGVADRVVFGGFAEAPERVYPGFDVLCFPSTTGESLGIALLESMACGCPAIASAVGGVPEILNDPQAGWLIPMGDASALFQAMGAAMDAEPEMLSRMGVRARERVLADFEASDRLNDFVKVIESIFEQVH